MNNDVQQDASCCLFQFEGELRQDHVEGMSDLVEASAGNEPRHILVDCRRVSRFDETALEALVDFQSSVAARGGKVVLVGLAHPRLKDVIFLDWNEPERPRVPGPV